MTPDLLPLLRKGIGKTPAEGGCLFQVASYLYDGESWADSTPCVHPTLRQTAIYVNDQVSEDYRPKLAPTDRTADSYPERWAKVCELIGVAE